MAERGSARFSATFRAALYGALRAALWAVALLASPGLARAGLDLTAATVERLDNGLTVIVLEEPALPVASVQMLYRVGARNESFGETGLAHFLEHMAFRSSENFPDTGLVSSIYAVGGEWHGYTWLDQTTYFATVPKDYSELLLRIEADRMARLDIPAADVEAERGAVLTEMHGYENDPAAVLQDHVMYLSFLAHPYRNNTIGWESDVAGIRHEELVAFYRRHYQPGNAVLAVVGDVDRDDVLEQVRSLFGGFAGAAATPLPRTVEPPQAGERRIRLSGAVQRRHFKIAWHAPSVHSPDYAAFLVLQDLLSGGSGASFLQNDWGTPARSGSPLAAVADDVDSWYPPSEQDYVFAVSGSIAADADANTDEAALEAAVTRAIEQLVAMTQRGDAEAQSALAAAKERVLRALRFDVLTTEDAAHQLAFFGGMNALPVLFALPAAVQAVELEDVNRVATARLGQNQRSIGWLVPGGQMMPAPADAALPTEAAAGPSSASAPGDAAQVGNARKRASARDADGVRLGTPQTRALDSGTVAIAQRSPLSPTVRLEAVLAGAVEVDDAEVHSHDPAWGYTTAAVDLLPAELPDALAALAAGVSGAQAVDANAGPDGADPLAHLDWHFREILGLRAVSPAGGPVLVVASGDLDPTATLAQIDSTFGAMPPSGVAPPPGTVVAPGPSVRMQVQYRLDRAFAQEALGYVVPAPGAREADAAAWQVAVYLLSHGYEGRLGKEAISRRGLVYYIDAAYGSDGWNGWVTLATGVDPDKLPDMRRLLWSELQRLLDEPPTRAELDEARQHLLGRRLSAAQSNEELAGRHARDWLWYGALPDHGQIEERLERITLDDLHRILPAFTTGTVISVRNPRPE
ncbi:MAG: insulinase family protein [Xanthomonadales bacterium]|nr:insulinase family protein [Xanthomonadales bacterium]